MTDSKPSKSERKREQQSLQALGEQLIDLQDDLLDGLGLDERLHGAILDARRMKSHEAQRRQKQYIGKLMRDIDPAPVHALLDRLRADDRREKRIFVNAERWRDRLLRDGAAALPEFEAECGTHCPDLKSLLTDLDHTVSDRNERGIRRSIFRHIHDALAARPADG